MAQQRLELTWYNKDLALIPTQHGRYGYSWVSPDDPRYCETRSLVMDEYVHGTQSAKSDDFTYSERADLPPTDDNLLILGESGDVLETLIRTPELRDKYAGKVKCIYIDPPFNTAQSFPNQNYEDNLEHSIWLTMMRDRLVNMKKLLSDDGSIWVHLDDNENHRMRLLMDEVFGADNFVAEVVWQNGVHVRNDANFFSSNNDTIVVYGRSLPTIHKLPPSREMTSRFKNTDGDARPWQSVTATAPGGESHQGMVYAIQHPITGKMLYPSAGRHWSNGQTTVLKSLQEWASYKLKDIADEQTRARLCGLGLDEIKGGVHALVLAENLETSSEKAKAIVDRGAWPDWFFTGPGGVGSLRRKNYMPENFGRVPSTVWNDLGRNDDAKREIQRLFPGANPFSTPKPENLLERIIHIATNPGDIVFDCFAGSGTTAAVAQKMGRRWITCELIDDTFTKFTRPRLKKVVAAADSGGITKFKGERVADTDPPVNVDVEEAYRITRAFKQIKEAVDLPIDLAALAQKAARRDKKTESPALSDNENKELLRLLKKFGTSTETTIDVLPEVAKTVNAAFKTKRAKDVITWRGGGGFQAAHLSPACFDYDTDLGLVTLTEAANEHGTLASNVAAHLGFYRDSGNDYFDGCLGTMQLLVTRNTVTETLVEAAVSHLGEGQRVTIAATSIADGAAQALRGQSRGSRIIHILNDLFPVQKETNT